MTCLGQRQCSSLFLIQYTTSCILLIPSPSISTCLKHPSPGESSALQRFLGDNSIPHFNKHPVYFSYTYNLLVTSCFLQLQVFALLTMCKISLKQREEQLGEIPVMVIRSLSLPLPLIHLKYLSVLTFSGRSSDLEIFKSYTVIDFLGRVFSLVYPFHDSKTNPPCKQKMK